MMKEYLSVYSYNATSISGENKLSEFNSSFTGQSYDVISVTETWFHDGIFDSEILTKLNYAIYRNDRNSKTSAKKKGGGAMIAVHNNLTSHRRRDLEADVEIVWVEIKIDDTRKAYIGTYIISPCAHCCCAATSGNFS